MGPRAMNKGIDLSPEHQEAGIAYRKVWQQMGRDSLEIQTLEPGFWVCILALELTSYIILGELFNHLCISFFTCKIIIIFIIVKL